MTWNPRPDTVKIIDAARVVIADAAAAGYRFTLRRVYYGLVAQNIIPNIERSYKNLSAALTRARMEGLIPLHSLDDLGRSASVWESWDSIADLASDMGRRFRTDWWADADPYVELWAEKQAVASIVEPVCSRFGVPFLACRGFSSLTALAEAADRFDNRETVVLYVGDHDPSGLDMDRDLQNRLDRLDADVGLVRVALTVDQIDEHNLPPQPTKSTDSRAFGYSREHGGSWELDALPADVLAGLVRTEIESLLPDDFEDRRSADDEARSALVDFAATL